MSALIKCLKVPMRTLLLQNSGLKESRNILDLYVPAFSTGSPLQEASCKSNELETPDKLYRLIEVEVRGNDPAVLKSYAQYTSSAANHLGIERGKSWTPAKAHHERFTVLRSVHVNKKCRVQYEFRTYFHFMQFLRMTGSTADTFLEYIQRNLPEGVSMKVTKVAIETMPDHIKVPDKEDHIAESY